MKLWIGKEKEGCYKGNKTLFVGTAFIGYDEINKILESEEDIIQIYFGAGLCSQINYKVVRKCIKHHIDNTNITIEVSIDKLKYVPSDILNYVELMLTINNKDAYQLKKCIIDNTQIKIQSLKGEKAIGVIMLDNIKFADIKKFKRKCYKGDKIIK